MPARIAPMLLAALVSCLIFPGTVSASQWAKMYGGGGIDSGGIQPAGDGNYNLVGTTTSFGAGGTDAIFGKLDPFGSAIWAKTVGGTGDDSLVIDESPGGFVVTGTTKSFSGDGQWNILWAKFDAAWTPVYQRILAGSGSLTAGAFLPSADGGLIFTGSTNAYSGSASDVDLLVVKTNASGGMSWTKVLHYGPFDAAGPVAVETSDGGYLVPALVQEAIMPGFNEILLVKLSSTGAVQWKKLYTTTAGIPSASILKRMPDGGYLLFGNMTSFSPVMQTILLMKIDASGSLQWQKSYGSGALNTMGLNLSANDDGSLIVTGDTMDTSFENHKILIMKLDSTGAILWQKSFGDTGNNTGTPLFATPDGGFLFSGLRYGTTSPLTDILYGKLDANFDPVWMRTFGGTQGDGGLLMNDSAGFTLGGFTDSFGAGDGTTNIFGMTLDSNGNYPGCHVNPVTLTKANPGLTASNVDFSTTANPTLTERTAGSAVSVSLTVQSATLTQTDICASVGNTLLSVTPAEGLAASGTQGGPFGPPSASYTLQNTGATSINWTATKGQAWVSLSETGGTLAAGASTTVTVSVNSGANTLAPGSYGDTVSFTNTTNGNGNTTRPVSLTVGAASHRLTVLIGGSSVGTVTSNVGGIGCAPTCSANISNGTVVTLTATPGAGDTFKWRGDACDGSTSLTCQVPMTGPKTIRAVFSKTFTDASLTAGMTIKAVHFTELRDAINMLRIHNGLGAFGWTDISFTPKITPVKRQHLLDLRTALDQAYGQAVKTHTPYAESIVAGSIPIKASHLSELRTHVRGLE